MLPLSSAFTPAHVHCVHYAVLFILQPTIFLVQRPNMRRPFNHCRLIDSQLYKQFHPHTSVGRCVAVPVQTGLNNLICCLSKEQASAFRSWIERRSCRAAAVVRKHVALYADSDLFKCSGPNLSMPRLRVSDVLHGDPKFKESRKVSCSMFLLGMHCSDRA